MANIIYPVTLYRESIYRESFDDADLKELNIAENMFNPVSMDLVSVFRELLKQPPLTGENEILVYISNPMTLNADAINRG